MATDQHTCFTARCDECKNTYENGDGITLHFDSAAEAENEAEGCDWQKLADGRLICDRCTHVLLERGEIEEDPEESFAYRLAPSYSLAAEATSA